MPKLYDAFISYARQDSTAFAITLYEKLTKHGFNIWLDQSDMPRAVNFPEEIKQAITKSHNFIFIISPRAVQSTHCLDEINEAAKLNKRIIPLMYLTATDGWDNLPDIFKKLDRIFCRQDKLDNGEIDFDNNCITDIVTVLGRQSQQIEQHTRLLVKAAEWKKNLKQSRYLLTGEERKEAVSWLQPASKCQPTDLQCEYICESTINANNLLTQVFISYARPDKIFMEKLRQTLRRHHITVWTDKNDSQINETFQYHDTTQQQLNERIEEADNFLYIVSTDTASSTVCQQQLKYASSVNKRIIALEIVETDWAPPSTLSMQLIDFKQYAEHDSECANQLLQELLQHADYYEQHKHLLVKALKWQRQNYKGSLLLRGRNLEKFEAWFEMAQSHPTHPPLPLQKEFIHDSGNQLPEATLDTFISYSQTDADFARQLNEALQLQGKTTWFDQESILVGDDFKKEIWRGIEQCNNFLFIISPSSIDSPYCEKEANYALSLNKRMTNIWYRPVAVDKLPAALKNIQWIDFNSPKNFNTPFNELSRALETDREYTLRHTKWMLWALEWSEQKRSIDLVLRGQELARAEKWLLEAERQNKQPTPTTLQQEFIAESRKKAIVVPRFQTIKITIIIFILLLSIGIFLYKTAEPPEPKPVITFGIFRDIFWDGTEGPEMEWIPAGLFLMGDIQGEGHNDEQPVHKVFVERFAIGRYEVTFAEYDKFADATGRKKPDDRGWGRGNLPVINVSWSDATAYTEWVTEQTGYQYRLPTEKEWEYAARAGTETSRYWGNDPDEACRYANVYDNTSKEENRLSWTNHNCTDGYAQTAPVGRLEPNAFGLFDMMGNVWEWTCSEYHSQYNGQENSCMSLESGSILALRGGSWYNRPMFVRAANRNRSSHGGRGVNVGFRLARSS